MKIAVIGAGNMGCVYGANLARIGEEVSFLDLWEDHVNAIRNDGLILNGVTGHFCIRANARTRASDLPKTDGVLICVNSYATEAAAQEANELLVSDGFCLTLQNGVGNVEKLSAVLGDGRVLAGLSFQSGDLEGPGRVRHTNNGPTYIGELDGSRTPRLAAIVDRLSRAGLNPVMVDDIRATIWAKFVHNCGINGICAITGLRPGQIRLVPELDSFQTRIIEETVALVRAKGIQLQDPDPVTAIKEYCSHKFHRPSMMQHLDRGQRTEIDSLNGYVAEESARLGLDAPFSRALTDIVKGREFRSPVPPDVN